MEFLLSRTSPRCCVLQDMFGMYGSSLFEFPIVLKTPDLVVAVLLRCQQSTTQTLSGSLQTWCDDEARC